VRQHPIFSRALKDVPAGQQRQERVADAKGKKRETKECGSVKEGKTTIFRISDYPNAKYSSV